MCVAHRHIRYTHATRAHSISPRCNGHFGELDLVGVWLLMLPKMMNVWTIYWIRSVHAACVYTVAWMCVWWRHRFNRQCQCKNSTVFGTNHNAVVFDSCANLFMDYLNECHSLCIADWSEMRLHYEVPQTLIDVCMSVCRWPASALPTLWLHHLSLAHIHNSVQCACAF